MPDDIPLPKHLDLTSRIIEEPDVNMTAEHTTYSPVKQPEKEPSKRETGKRPRRATSNHTHNEDACMRPPPHKPQTPTSGERLTILTQNCRNILDNATSLNIIIDRMKPHIMFLTETKINSRNNKPETLKRILQDYSWGISSATNKMRKNYLYSTKPSAGVIVAVHKMHAGNDKLKTRDPPNGLNGYICHTCIPTEDGTPLHLIGVYAPEKQETRNKIFEYLKDQATKCAQEGHLLLIGGDWNAVLHTDDRNTKTLDTADRAFQTFCLDNDLTPLHNSLPRQHTYTQTIRSQEAHRSRIDDVITNKFTRDKLALSGNPDSIQENVIDTGGSLDHSTLIHTIAQDSLKLSHTQTSNKDTRQPSDIKLSFVNPINKESLDNTRKDLEAHISGSAAQQRMQTDSHKQSLLQKLEGDHSALNLQRYRENHNEEENKKNIDSQENHFRSLLGEALGIMRKHCATKSHATKQIYKNRKAKKGQEKLFNKQQALKPILRAYKEAKLNNNLQGFQDTMDTNMASANPDSLAHIEKIPKHATHCAEWDQWEKEVTCAILNARKEFRGTDKTDKKTENDKKKKAFQSKLAKNQKAGHREIFNPGTGEAGSPHVIRHHETGIIHHKQSDVLQAVHSFFSKLMTPPSPKNGLYLPEDSPRHLPWSAPGATDRFDLECPAKATQNSEKLLDIILDRATLDKVILNLSRGKKSGPDEIPNELLQNLPDDAIHTIHNLFIQMWITGKTPTSWKQSNTILLYKKDDSLDTGNYRPIALSNAIYKLWTSTITEVLSTYAEDHHMLSSSQEGFRKHKNTNRQLRNLLQVIEDAALTGKNLYNVYIDFSSAFNMVDHDKLLCIMHDLGFPTDAIEIVKNIYSDSTTRIIAAGGISEAVPVNRGTIQGDSLSPFLFLVFIEPLLRWLHAGGRGYRYGSLPSELNDKYSCSSLAYADDLAIPTDNLQNLQIQMQKLEKYLDWSGLKVNASKCAVTGTLHGAQPTTQHPNTTLRQQLDNKISIHGSALPYLEPNKSYKYLGVYINMALDWKDQLNSSIQKATERAELLTISLASFTQKLRVIETCIKPVLTYCFPLAPYTAKEIDALDGVLVRITKAVFKLPHCAPRASILLSKEDAGLGVTSLWIDYIQKNTESLSSALSDKGKLGAITEKLLKLQNKRTGSIIRSGTENHTRYHTALRQLAMCKAHGIDIIAKGERLCTDTNELWEKLKTQNATMNPTFKKITASLINPLLELGLCYNDITENGGRYIISTSQLNSKMLRLGRCISPRHKIALNRVTLVLSQNYEPGTNPLSYKRVSDLTRLQRQLPTTWSTETEVDTLTTDHHSDPPTRHQHKRQQPPQKDEQENPTSQRHKRDTAPESQGSHSATPPARDAHLSNQERQGCWPGTAGHNQELDIMMRRMVKTRPSPIDPDRDITAPNKFTIQIGLHRTLNDSHNMHTAYVYTPSGRCVGQMTIETLNKLKLQHHTPLSTGKARATTMEEDTAKLMATYDTKNARACARTQTWRRRPTT